MEGRTPPSQQQNDNARLQEWLENFHQCLRVNPGAERTWSLLSSAGLETEALARLWQYAHGMEQLQKSAHRDTERLARKAEDTVRAIHVAETRIPKSARDADLFRARAAEQVANLVGSDWPMAGSGTLLDVLNSIGQHLGAEPPLELLATNLRKAAGPRSPLNRFFPLLWLREHARARGLVLGVKKIQWLAACADPEGGPDSSSLSRYFRDNSDLADFIRGRIKDSPRQS